MATTTVSTLPKDDIAKLKSLGMTESQIKIFTAELAQEGITDLSNEDLNALRNIDNFKKVSNKSVGVDNYATGTGDLSLDALAKKVKSYRDKNNDARVRAIGLPSDDINALINLGMNEDQIKKFAAELTQEGITNLTLGQLRHLKNIDKATPITANTNLDTLAKNVKKGKSNTSSPKPSNTSGSKPSSTSGNKTGGNKTGGGGGRFTTSSTGNLPTGTGGTGTGGTGTGGTGTGGTGNRFITGPTGDLPTNTGGGGSTGGIEIGGTYNTSPGRPYGDYQGNYQPGITAGGPLDPNVVSQTDGSINNLVGNLAGYTQATAGNALSTALAQGDAAKKLSDINTAATLAQLRLGNLFEEAQVSADLLNTLATQGLALSAKSWESALLVAQYREKTAGMFLAIADQRSSNSFTRIKSLTQGFKF